MSTFLLALLACTTVPSGTTKPTPTPTPTPAPTPAPTTSVPPDPTTPTTEEDCPTGPGSPCDPFEIATFPYEDVRNTESSANFTIDAYDCAPDTDEGGAEWWYTFTLAESGILTAAIDERDGDGVDIDVHLLDGTDASDCLARDHVGVGEFLEAGTYFLSLDTYVSDGVEQPGRYVLDVDFRPAAADLCAVVPTDVEMFWSSCAASVPDCFERGGSVFLATPTVGPVVKEAHLVTTDDGFGGSWPTSFTDGIAHHYAISEAATGYGMRRTEPWAPSGEGGSEYGQGATGAKVPVEDEAWYLNMYWRDKPTPGTRMIVRNPANGRAVVASGGYETGPGDNTRVAGVTEEVHDWLGTGHLDDLEIGFAEDQTLPLGPIDCP